MKFYPQYCLLIMLNPMRRNSIVSIALLYNY